MFGRVSFPVPPLVSLLRKHVGVVRSFSRAVHAAHAPRSTTKYKHVIWDWNGTLMDDVWLCVDVMNKLLAKRNKQAIDVQKHRSSFDFPVRVYYERLGFDMVPDGEHSFESMSVEFVEHYGERMMQCGLYEHARQTLAALQSKGVTQSVLSAFQHDKLTKILHNYQIASHFCDIQGHADIFAKSKIDNGHAVMARLKVSPKDVVLIGDTIHDHEVAQALGVDCLLLSHGHHTLEKLTQCGVPVLHSLEELSHHVSA